MKLKYYLRGIGVGMIVTAAVLHFTFAKAGGSMSDEQIKARAKELGMIENTLLKSSASENDADISVGESGVISIGTPSSLNDASDVSKNKPGVVSANSASSNSATSDSGTSDSATSTASGNSVSANNTVSENQPKRGTTLNPDDFKDDVKQEAADDKQDESANNKNSTDNKDSADNKKTDSKTDASTKPEDGSKYKTGNTSGETVEYKVITVNSGDGSYAVAKKVADAGIVKSAAEFDEFMCQNDYDKILVTGEHRIPVDASYKEIADILTSAASR